MSNTFGNSTFFTFKNFIKENMMYAENSLAGVVMNTMGDDFTYQFAQQTYEVLDAMLFIHGMNSGEKDSPLATVTMKYSTVKNFHADQDSKVKSKNIQNIFNPASKLKRNVKINGDFYPYLERGTPLLGGGGSWVGYFTTRPFLKNFI